MLSEGWVLAVLEDPTMRAFVYMVLALPIIAAVGRRFPGSREGFSRILVIERRGLELEIAGMQG